MSSRVSGDLGAFVDLNGVPRSYLFQDYRVDLSWRDPYDPGDDALQFAVVELERVVNDDGGVVGGVFPCDFWELASRTRFVDAIRVCRESFAPVRAWFGRWWAAGGTYLSRRLFDAFQFFDNRARYVCDFDD